MDETTTGNPALVFVGERDDVWHPDILIEWVEELTNRGNPIKLAVLKDTYHGLGTQSVYCSDKQTVRNCKSPLLYNEKGNFRDGRSLTRRDGLKQCGAYGFHCFSKDMDMYPEMLRILIEFLNENIGTKKQI